VKITLNVDEDILTTLRKLAAQTGVPYQSLLNKMLSDTLSSKRKEESRGVDVHFNTTLSIEGLPSCRSKRWEWISNPAA
jgi:hypothetical protein